jgi:hypothetical protein
MDDKSHAIRRIFESRMLYALYSCSYKNAFLQRDAGLSRSVGFGKTVSQKARLGVAQVGALPVTSRTNGLPLGIPQGLNIKVPFVT